jgi:hypothetical protein
MISEGNLFRCYILNKVTYVIRTWKRFAALEYLYTYTNVNINIAGESVKREYKNSSQRGWGLSDVCNVHERDEKYIQHFSLRTRREDTSKNT